MTKQYNKKRNDIKDFVELSKHLLEYKKIIQFLDRWDGDDLEARRDDITDIIDSVKDKISKYHKKMETGQFTSVEKEIDDHTTEHYSPEARELLQLEKNLAKLKLERGRCVEELRIDRAIEEGNAGYELDEDGFTVHVKKAFYKFSEREFMVIKMLYEAVRLNSRVNIETVRKKVYDFELKRHPNHNLIQRDELFDKIYKTPMSNFIGGTSEKNIFRRKYVDDTKRPLYRLRSII
jgi:hypothetical protein